MAEYIDLRDAWSEETLIDWYLNSIENATPPVWTEEHISELCNDFIVIPKRAPRADARLERYGNWKRFRYKGDRHDTFHCSECGHLMWHITKFCPDCGAKMDGGKNGR